MRQVRGSSRVRPRLSGEAGQIAARMSGAAVRGDLSADIDPGIGFDVLRHMIVQVGGRMRETLAERLADRVDMPRDLALILANDSIDVAYPILTRSPVLRDDDLIALIHDHGHDHHLAIAARPSLGPAVTEILVELADDDVVQRVLHNDGARFSGHTMRRLAAMAHDTEAWRAPLVARRELGRDVARVLYMWVGDSLRRTIAERFGDGIAEELQTDTGRAAAEQFARDYLRDFSRPDQDVASGAPASPRIAAIRPLVKALRDGDLAGVETAIGEMTGLPTFAVARILHNPGPEPLAVVCRALDLPKAMFSAVYLRLHGVRPYTVFQQTPTFRNALIYFNRLQANQARALLDTWRRAPITVWRHANGA